jgi:integrase
LQAAGAYVIDKRIKNVPEFAGMNLRLAKTTGVFPGQRNAATIVSDMKLMVKELVRERDVLTLRKIQAGTLSLPSAYKRWREGRVHLAEEFTDCRVLKEWLKYVDGAPLAARTKSGHRAMVASLVAKQLLTEQAVVNDLPEVVKKIHRHYAATKQAPAFNKIMTEMGAFLTKGLGMDRSSQFVRDVLRVPRLKQENRRDHHPFYTPRECADFCTQLHKRRSRHASHYVDAVLFMCMHGLRPDEFEDGLFLIDSETEHLRVHGTKNPNAKRLVPLSLTLPNNEGVQVNTLNRMFERMNSPVRCRDFRRTFSIWCESAGILPHHISAYMGHASQNVTQRYQKAIPKQAMLDADRELLWRWYEKEMNAAPEPRKKTQVSSTFRERVRAVSLPLATLRARVIAAANEAKSAGE